MQLCVSQKFLRKMKIIVPIHAALGWFACVIFFSLMVDQGDMEETIFEILPKAGSRYFSTIFLVLIGAISAASIPFVFQRRKIIKFIILVLQLPIVLLSLTAFIIVVDVMIVGRGGDMFQIVTFISTLIYAVTTYWLLLFFLFFGKVEE